MTNTTKCMTSYDNIQPIKTYISIEDYIQQLNAFSAEMAGKMKYAFEEAKKQAFNRGLVDRYEDGRADYEDKTIPAGFKPVSPESTEGALF